MKTNHLLLGVNIDHIATLRQARGTRYPDPVQAGLMAEQAGADSITVHLREDRRHIQDRDVLLLKQVLSIPINFEMAVTEEMLSFAEQLKPRHVCLVPEKREELTTEGGLDVIGQREKIKVACARLTQAGIETSLFIAPDLQQLEAAVDCKAPAVEIHTGHYADLENPELQLQELEKIQRAATWSKKAGLIVNAGHGLNYQNIHPIAAIPEFLVLNIGHSIIARAVFTGLTEAIVTMKQLMLQAR